METCRNAFAKPGVRENVRAEAAQSGSVSMAEVRLVNVKKIYPFVSGEEKKKKKKKGDEVPEKKHNLQITEQGVVAVQQFNLDIKDREFIVLVGPSGCGKSTTLRMVAGLEEITEGELYIDGKLMNDVAPKDRDIAMVFQDVYKRQHLHPAHVRKIRHRRRRCDRRGAPRPGRGADAAVSRGHVGPRF